MRRFFHRIQKHHVKRWSVIWTVLADLMAIGIMLVVFALFHHVIPRKIAVQVRDVPIAVATPWMLTTSTTKFPTETFASTALPSVAPVMTTHGDAIKPLECVPTVNPTIILSMTPRPTITMTPSPTEAAVPTPSPTLNRDGDFGMAHAEQFLQDGSVSSENTYISEDIAIAIMPVSTNGVTYYIADIYIRNIENLRTGFAKDTYGKGIREPVETMAERQQAVLAISGDYYGNRDRGVVIRNGQIYRETVNSDVCVLYRNGVMETYAQKKFDIKQAIAQGAYQAWSFGPMLLENGQSMTTFNSKVNPQNPRCAIGYYEPGHYCMVLVDGRQKGYSRGMTLEELSQLFYELGCQSAYNLDGGQTAVMWFQGGLVNQPFNKGRPVSDMVYIGE